MSRTTLCLLTAAGLAALAVASMLARRQVLGDEIRTPAGPGTWKVTLLVQGAAQGNARLTTLTPLDLGHQRLLRESCRSPQLVDRLPDARKPERHPEYRAVSWLPRPGADAGDFRACYEFFCATDVPHPAADAAQRGKLLHAPPAAGEYLDVEARDGADAERLAACARQVAAGRDAPAEQAEALFHFVDQTIGNEPSVRGGPGASAADCLKAGAGDPRAKSRLLTALLRSRGIPARMVTGLKLAKGDGQLAHYWVEAWPHDRWVPLCPFFHLHGRVPPTYLVFGYGDLSVVRGRNLRDLDYAFLVEKSGAGGALAGDDASWLRRTLRALSLFRLPPAEQRLVEFLLLLPVAALIICVFRNVIGLNSFGTFAPALVGLAFRDLHSLPGLAVFVAILLLGWLLRRLLDRYHLLQVPRTAFMLSLVVVVLIAGVVAANFQQWEATKYVSLFPLVILTGMIERFWTLETEDGTGASFKTLVTTVLIAATISLALSPQALVDFLFCYPETLGLVMAVQLLLGRYTGYRLAELFRFRDFLRPPAELRLRTFFEG